MCQRASGPVWRTVDFGNDCPKALYMSQTQMKKRGSTRFVSLFDMNISVKTVMIWRWLQDGVGKGEMSDTEMVVDAMSVR